MISIGAKRIEAFFVGATPVAAIYLGSRLIWTSASSCFGSGTWLNDKTWINDETWIN